MAKKHKKETEVGRRKLSARRACVTVRVQWAPPGGKDHSILVTFGFDGEGPGFGGKIKEVFVASFRANAGLVALVNDACIMYSRLLQHGDSLEQLAATMVEDRYEGEDSGPPASMLGAVARKAVELQKYYDGLIEVPSRIVLTRKEMIASAVRTAFQEIQDVEGGKSK